MKKKLKVELTPEEKRDENHFLFYELLEFLNTEKEVICKTNILKVKRLINKLYTIDELNVGSFSDSIMNNLSDYILDMSFIFKKLVEYKLFDLSDIVYSKGITFEDGSIQLLCYYSYCEKEYDIIDYLISKDFYINKMNRLFFSSKSFNDGELTDGNEYIKYIDEKMLDKVFGEIN
jgi:hypothetical protein